MSVGPAVQKGDWYSQPITLLGIDNTQSPLEHSSKRPDSMLNQSHIGKDSTWRLKWWFNKNQQKQMITGYPEAPIPGEGSMTAQPAPAVPYNQAPPPVTTPQPQNAPQPLQQANVQNTGKPAYTERDASICRQCAGKVAGEVVAAIIKRQTHEVKMPEVTGQLLEITDIMSSFFLEGTVKADEPQPQEQGVCPSCQLLRVDCTCPQQDFIN